MRRRKALPCYLLAFALPVLILTAVYRAEGFYPFGDKSILVSDMAQQYVEYFCALKNGGLFFSWSKALGTSYIGVFSYYLSSPLSLLTLLVPNQQMPLGLLGLTLLKLGLAGLTFARFSHRYFHRLDLVTLVGSVCYALCAYAVAYALCIMWLDGLIWLPLILLGMDRLLDGGSRWPLVAALTVCFFSTWYLSYMIGGFCLLWLVFRAVGRGLDRRAFLRALGQVALSALLALGLTAWLWLPSFLAMFSGKFAAATADYAGLFNFSLGGLFPQLLFGHFQYFTNQALPYLFCGTVTLPAALAYFFLPCRPLRERLAAAGVAAVLVLSLWLSPLDKVWHLFQYPNWFPYRYAFLLSFFLVFLAQHALGAAYDACRARRPRPAAAAAGVLLLLVCVELGANARLILRGIDGTGHYESYSAYVDDYTANAALTAAAQADGDGFFRVGAAADRGLNSPLAFGYNGITHYSSLYNSEVNAALKSLGFAQSWFWCAYYGSTQATDALLDIRYVISDQAVPGYQAVASVHDLTLWKAPAVLPLAFSAQGVDASGGSPIQLQNSLFSALTGQEDPLFLPADPVVNAEPGVTTLTFSGAGQPIYLDLTADGLTALWVDDELVSRLDSGETRRLYCLGAPAQGETLTAVVTHTAADLDLGSQSFVLSTARLAEAVAQLDNVQLSTVTRWTVELTASGDDGPVLATTIPAEDGWTAYVDGQRVDTRSWLGAFLALDLPAGQHTVTLRYTPPGLLPGAALGVLALAAIIALLISSKRRAQLW